MPLWLRHPILYFAAWYSNVQTSYHEQGYPHVCSFCIACWNGEEIPRA